jgi:hypothetical protein|tara:strand:+ start:15079 stop:15543 length:465 start_codon:yes stop_codon:yes gene_type:complete
MYNLLGEKMTRNVQKVLEESLLARKRENPELTVKFLAEWYDLPLHRVRYLLQKHELIPYKHSRCSVCSVKVTGRRKYCDEHRRMPKMVEVICAGCGEVFERKASLVKKMQKDPRYEDDKHYHSRACFGTYIGTTFGFGQARTLEKALNTRRNNE